MLLHTGPSLWRNSRSSISWHLWIDLQALLISIQLRFIMNSSFDLSSEVSETSLSSESEPSSSDSELEPEIHHQWLFYKQCCQIQALKFITGWIYSKIMETIELPLSTVFNVWLYPATSLRHKSRVKISTPIHKRLISEATKNAESCHKIFHEVAISINLDFDSWALCHVFVKENYHCYHVWKKSFLINLHKLW